MRKFALIVGTSVSLLLLSSAFAHHGWGGYTEQIQMNVTITALKLGNPHDRLVVADGDDQEWNLLLAPPARNRRFGFNKESLSVGDIVVVIGQKHPQRREVKVHCLKKDGENLYTYRYDSGKSSLERLRKGEDCTFE
jgi:hypothetical protein